MQVILQHPNTSDHLDGVKKDRRSARDKDRRNMLSYRTQKAIRQWHFCPQSCGWPIPAVAKAMDGAVRGVPAHDRVWVWMGFKFPSNPNHPVILWQFYDSDCLILQRDPPTLAACSEISTQISQETSTVKKTTWHPLLTYGRGALSLEVSK